MKAILITIIFSFSTISLSDIKKSDVNADFNAIEEFAELTKEQDLTRAQLPENPSENDRIDKESLIDSSTLRDYFNYRVVNSSTKTICRFYASPDESTSWGADRLVDVTLASNYSFYIDVSVGGCRYDFKALFCDGDIVYGLHIDICSEALVIVDNSKVY